MHRAVRVGSCALAATQPLARLRTHCRSAITAPIATANSSRRTIHSTQASARHSAAAQQTESRSDSQPDASAQSAPQAAPSTDPPVPLPSSGPRVLGLGRVAAIAAATQDDMRRAGVRAEVRVLEDTQASDAQLVSLLRDQRWDAVVIGGGLSGRSPFVPPLTTAQQARFEAVKASVAQHAPQATLVLPTGPRDLIGCLERALGNKLPIVAAETAAANSASSTELSPGAAAWNASHAAQYQPLSLAQRSLLLVGASALSLLDPHRGDLVAAVGELVPLTDLPLESLRQRMQSSEEGRWLLRHKPRLNSRALPLQHIKDTLPAGSLGGQYARFMLERGYSADERAHVKFVRDPELAYVLQRYREIHDLLHVLTGMPTSVLGELGQKAFESVHFRLTMPTLSATIAPPLTLSPAHRSFFYSTLWPWAKQLQSAITVTHLIAVRYELYLQRDLQDLRREWGITPTPQMPD